VRPLSRQPCGPASGLVVARPSCHRSRDPRPRRPCPRQRRPCPLCPILPSHKTWQRAKRSSQSRWLLDTVRASWRSSPRRAYQSVRPWHRPSHGLDGYALRFHSTGRALKTCPIIAPDAGARNPRVKPTLRRALLLSPRILYAEDIQRYAAANVSPIAQSGHSLASLQQDDRQSSRLPCRKSRGAVRAILRRSPRSPRPRL
jgi:hypothetical protein